MPISAYVICATPRLGSTLLCDLLAATGIAGQPQSYFRAEDISYWADMWDVSVSTDVAEPEFNCAYLAAMKRFGTAGTGIFGLRLMWQSVAEASRCLDSAFGCRADFAPGFMQAFGPTLFIHLSRRDKIAQAISLVRAEQTGLWHVAADGSERERTAVAQEPKFDAERINEVRDGLESDDRAWTSFFVRSDIAPLCLTYETLAADPQSTLTGILAALGRDATGARYIGVLSRRMADATNTEWAERLKKA